ncbi:MAG: nucleotidyltransferase family protein [Chloroflexota bacterium]|nr:nucleotidyltransferase family protein [Chloroflexota bacterium]
MKVSAVVLAAGAALRFGRPKQLERWPTSASPTLVERVVHLAAESGVSEVLVVTGNRAEEVTALFGDARASTVPVSTIYNPRWQEGQGFSVAVGIKALAPRSAAALFFLSDQPRLKLASAQALVQHFTQAGPEREIAILIPTYHGRRGNPVLFGRHYFAALAILEGDVGGRVVVKSHPQAVQEVEVDDPAILEDVDTLEELVALQ